MIDRRMSSPGDFRTPIFFKLWFAFIACLIVCAWFAIGYIIYSAISAGPDGVGHAIGGFVKAARESAQ